MGLAVLIGGIILVVAVWIVTKKLPRNTSYATRLFVIGLTLGIGGILAKGEEKDLVAAAGTIASNIGIAFIVFGILVYIRAYFAGEFK